jgi:hypothetical protein
LLDFENLIRCLQNFDRQQCFVAATPCTEVPSYHEQHPDANPANKPRMKPPELSKCLNIFADSLSGHNIESFPFGCPDFALKSMKKILSCLLAIIMLFAYATEAIAVTDASIAFQPSWQPIWPEEANCFPDLNCKAISVAPNGSSLTPEAVMFEMGRKLKNIGKSVDPYGRYLDSQGKVVTDSEKAAEASYSIYDLLFLTIKGFRLPLVGFFQEMNLPESQTSSDPLRGIAEKLLPLEEAAQDFYRNYNYYTAGFYDIAKKKGAGSAEGRIIEQTAHARGFLLDLANYIRILDKSFELNGFYAFRGKLEDPDANLDEIAKDLLARLLQTDFPEIVGKRIREFQDGVRSSTRTS